jgi:glycosyltransferase involved in cell wall biosynthesis
LSYAVTVGICVKNGVQTIGRTLKSVMAQDFPHNQIEVIIVDDGSNDGTLEVVRGLALGMDMNVRILHHRWQGIAEARNTVARNAEGKYIVWVDCDMVLTDSFIQEQYFFMENNHKVGIAKGIYGIIQDANLVASLENMSFVSENYRYECGTGGSIYRTQALRGVGYFDHRLRFAGEDHDAAFKISAAGWELERSLAIFYEYPRTSWRKLWTKYYNWGFGLHEACRANPNLVTLYEMTPFAGFAAGLKRALIAYRLTYEKKHFLLPFQFVFKLSAWCLGYLKGVFH